jgi:mRNA interferase HicA
LSYLRGVKGRELVRKLRRLGVEVEPRRGKGGHVRVRYRGRLSVVPMHGDKDIGPNLVQAICKQLGLDPTSVL